MEGKLEDKIHEERLSQSEGKNILSDNLEQKVVAEEFDDSEAVKKTSALVQKYGCPQSLKDEYEILSFLGEGVFAEIAKCLKKRSKEFVALKISKRQDVAKFSNECSILDKVNKENPDEFNFVRNVENFIYKEHFFMAFEVLERSLFNYMLEDGYNPIPMEGIRYVTQQLLVAQRKLKDLRIIHGDLKPENIMLVNQRSRPFKIKIIDFGMSVQLPATKYSRKLGSLVFRAPEILLGMNYSVAVDMWAVGCIVAEMLLGGELYPGRSPYDQIRFIDEMQGPFPYYMVSGKVAGLYFCCEVEEDSNECKWRVKKPEEYTKETGKEYSDLRRHHLPNMDALLPICSDLRKDYDEENVDRKNCVGLIKDMLKISPRDRMSPDAGLESDFITHRKSSN